MEFINLNNENYKLSKIGLGTGLGFYCGGIKQEKKLTNALEFAIENKINWIDTAESYFNGYSEKLIGKLLKDINKKIYILSKFSPQNAGKLKLRKAIENSLMRLNRDQIDIYQFHWPNVKIPWQETLETLMELLKEEKIGAIGVSNFSHENFETIYNICDINIQTHQLEYNLFNRTAETLLFPFHKDKKITTIGYSPFTGINNLKPESQKLKILQNIANKYKSKIHGITLAYLLSKTNLLVAVNSTNTVNIKNNICGSKIKLEDADIDKIDNIFRDKIHFININDINLSKNNNYEVYSSIDEAINNHLKLYPSPLELSEEYKIGASLSPIKVTKINNEFKLIGGMLRYWAWRIAFDGCVNKYNIPAIIYE